MARYKRNYGILATKGKMAKSTVTTKGKARRIKRKLTKEGWKVSLFKHGKG